MMLELELRRLELADLDAIEQIERASYRTPWSRSMFTSELAKPSSLSFGAVDETGELVGYLVLIVYFRARGGYKAQVLTGHSAEDAKFTGGVPAPVR